MANYATLKSSIAAAIKQNGNNEITGNLLQQRLLAMVNSLGVGYQYAGIATPATNPGTPDQNVFYIAFSAGTYANFGTMVLADGEIAILKWNGAWSKDSFNAPNTYADNVLKVAIGGLDLSGFAIGGINTETGAETVASTRIRTGFIDGRNNNIVVKTFNNIVLRFAICYNQIDGAPIRSVSFNTNEFTFRTDAYGCYFRFVFSRSDNGNCSPSDFQYISIRGVGLSNDLLELQQQVNAIPVIDFDTFKPWAEIPNHNGILLSTYMQVYGFAGNTHKVIPITGAKKIQVRANQNYIARFAIVKTYTEPSATGQTPFDFATGETSRRDIPIGTLSAVLDIPNDANFVIVSSLMGSESANAEPASLQIDGYDVILGEREEIGKLKEETKELQDRVFIDDTLEQGGINDNTGATTPATSRVRTTMLDGAFLIRVNDGYLINQVYKWSKAGAYIGAVEEDVPIGKSYEMEDSGFMYRVVMRKADNTDLLPTDDVVLELSVGLDYEYSRNIYGFTRAALSSEVEGKIIPFVRGTDEDRMSYDTTKEYERLVIGFMTDNHIDLGDKQASYNNVKDAIDFYNHLHIPVAAILEGGDAITKIVNTKALQIAHLERFFDMTWKAKMPFLFTKGNHDINTINVPPSLVLDDDDWGQIWFNRAETQYGIVRQTRASGKKSGYYYYDLDAWKVRIICVDCFDLDYTKVNGSGNVLYSGGAANWIAQEQYDWIANTALNFDDKTDKDWGVIVFMHYYRTYDEYGTDIEPKFTNPYRLFNDMLVAFNSQSDYEEVYSFPDNTFFNLNVSANFSRYASLEKKPYFISLITGHRHFDGNEVLDGVNNILTANQLCGENSADIRLKRVAHTKTQNLFDTFVIDLKARTIRAFRFGAGVTCYGNGGDRFLPNGLSF